MSEDTRTFEALAARWPWVAWMRKNPAAIVTAVLSAGGWLVVIGEARGGQTSDIAHIKADQISFQVSTQVSLTRLEHKIDELNKRDTDMAVTNALLTRVEAQVDTLQKNWDSAVQTVDDVRVPKLTGHRARHK